MRRKLIKSLHPTPSFLLGRRQEGTGNIGENPEIVGGGGWRYPLPPIAGSKAIAYEENLHQKLHQNVHYLLLCVSIFLGLLMIELFSPGCYQWL